MHNRNLEWITGDGRRLKIKKIRSSHLYNILKYIDKNYEGYVETFGVDKIELYKKTINQEIRYRKLKEIDLENNNELF